MHDRLVKILAINKKARDSSNLKEFGFLTVNETFNVVPYKQAVFWTFKQGRVNFQSISGNQIIEPHGQYAANLADVIESYKKKCTKEAGPKVPGVYSLNSGDLEQICEKNNFNGSRYALIFLVSSRDEIIGGLWLERDEDFSDQDKLLLQEIGEVYSFVLENHRRQKIFGPLSFGRGNFKFKIAIALFLFVLVFFPVRLSITAPAAIAPQNPGIATVPFDGVLQTVLVDPGKEVEKDEIIAQMDKTALQSELANASEALRAVRSELSGARRLAMRSPERKKELSFLQAEIALKKLDYERAAARLDESDIRAPRAGVAVYSKANELKGKPMRTGEKIMMIADPDEKLLQIRVPTKSMISINEDIPARFHMNVAPLSGYRARIKTVGYQATPDPDGLLTYKVRADLSPEAMQNVRLGWRGTAKLYGEWSVLSYAVIRRPLIFIRKVTGL